MKSDTVITTDTVAVLMAVAPERVSEILAQFNERVDSIVYANGLEHHKGTTALNPIQNIGERFKASAHANFTKPETTESMLYAAKDDAVSEIETIARNMSSKESFYLQGLGAAINPRIAADSKVWNIIVMDAATDIDRLGKTHAGIISNMPKLLQERLDQDLADILESINREFNTDPSANNAQRVSKAAQDSISTINKRMEEVGNATMKANIETIVQSKMTELQEKQIALASAEYGMTPPQVKSWRVLSDETQKMILDLGKSNYLVYDKSIRTQKLQVIDMKLALLETIRVNAVGVSQSLSGYYGSTGNRRVSRAISLGGIGSSLGMNTPSQHAPNNFINGIPPGFSGHIGITSKEQVASQLPSGAAKAHIDATTYFADQGMSIDKAANQATAAGYGPQSYGKTFSIGGGRRPLV